MNTSLEIKCAIKAVKSCEGILLNYFKKPLSFTKRSSKELVTRIDLECEKRIRQILVDSFPDYGFVGEETQREQSESKYFWVVDPIDGTTNFLHGLPQFVVTISLVEGNEPLLGVIYDPVHRELFTAEKDGGAFLNKKRVHVSGTTKLVDCVVQFDAGYNYRSRAGRLIEKIGDKIRSPQMGRSAALQMADVCCGRSDAYIKIKPYLWDVLAGALLIKEAGGEITDFSGKKYNPFKDENIIASNGKIHKMLLKKLGK